MQISHSQCLGALVTFVILPITIAAATPAHAAGNVIVKAKDVVCTASVAGCQKIANAAKTFQKISITVPSAGNIAVTISGYAICGHDDTSNAHVIAFFGQITDDTVDPDPFGAGAKSYLFSSGPAPVTTASSAVSLSMDSSRVFKVTAGGKYTFYYRQKGESFSATATCYLFGGNMAATFVPN